MPSEIRGVDPSQNSAGRSMEITDIIIPRQIGRRRWATGCVTFPGLQTKSLCNVFTEPMHWYCTRVRDLMEKYELDAFMTFTADCHLNEYIGPEDRLVLALTGFTGSNAIALTCAKNALITDSRYFIQAAAESSYPLSKDTPAAYLAQVGCRRVGCDPRMIGSLRHDKLSTALGENGIELVCVEDATNVTRPMRELVDLEEMLLADFLDAEAFWTDCQTGHGSIEEWKNKRNHSGTTDKRCINYANKIRAYLVSLGLEEGIRDRESNVTGSTYRVKLEKAKGVLRGRTCLICELDTIAWLLNLRGADIEYNPVFYAYMVLSEEDTVLYTDHTVAREGVTVRPYAEFERALEGLKERNIAVAGDCNYFVYSQFVQIERMDDIRAMQANKNATELAGMALSYFFDGVALTDLFGWMNEATDYTENDVANQLHELKKRCPGYVGPSFETISSTGANSAIVHHSSTDAVVDKTKAFLLDSGSHYFFGTTDTTRTLHFGGRSGEEESMHLASTSGTEMKELRHDNTLVFRGHFGAMIQLYAAEATYADIDAIARRFLKEEGKDFGHATGHGVGHFLCVHEHPPVISNAAEGELQPNQVFSVEPGYYVAGSHGVRIENLVFSRAADSGTELVNITMVPYQLSLLEVSLLGPAEKTELNRFNKTCRELLQDFLTPEGRAFLIQNTIDIDSI